jgi:glycogen debranching enzyme
MCSSPDLAAFLILQDDLLSNLASYLGHDGESSNWASKRDGMLDALITELWDEEKEVFLCKDAYTGETWTTSTLLKFVPLVAAKHLPKRIVKAMAKGLTAHMTRWGLATEDPKSPSYESDGYWRGPIWAPPTILIESGLRAGGEEDLADEVSRKFIALGSHAGFAENYDAITGVGNRDLSYTWSASTYLVLRAEEEARRVM